MERPILEVKHFHAWFGDHEVVKDVNLTLYRNKVIAVMGPSGCGKTTFLRCINRMHELTPGARTQGEILLEGENIYEMSPIVLRLRVGMVFQRPNPFPHLTIYENVLAGYLLNNIPLSRTEKDAIVEDSLRKAALWNEVKDNLKKKGNFLSGGQQQRLCIARAIAMKPDILLLDEPTSALDPISTAGIEELTQELKKNYTLILVTHNMQQAARVSDETAFFYMGELVEFAPTRQIFTAPRDQRTQNYITGRFS
ncbi:MAG: phosphate ABC transporter ATP-binding protein [Thermoflavifilum sp.]|jgi:phosphate transport system ATP-binding protein|uniref:phosphate ABC transporter ATP-binding protein PstB n=1 Tax=Thermoflavifilum sp. TaxID=1968839 RepID=UPI0018A4B488|nr:phosphate ABC transporter ATP-binding protein PstB [Thermoflavifilum sp.]QOR76542.1 MAG: phosphate ABC transporter ATP-binding protein [Thermoflavifilum sp.]